MTQLESDGLSIMARAWLLMAETKGDDEARGMRRTAKELLEWLQHANTSPAAAPSFTPAPAPRMRWPEDLPRGEFDEP